MADVIQISTRQPVDHDVAAKLRQIADEIDAGEIQPKRCLVVMQNHKGNVQWRIAGLPIDCLVAVGMLQWAVMDIFDKSSDPIED